MRSGKAKASSASYDVVAGVGDMPKVSPCYLCAAIRITRMPIIHNGPLHIQSGYSPRCNTVLSHTGDKGNIDSHMADPIWTDLRLALSGPILLAIIAVLVRTLVYSYATGDNRSTKK